MGRVGQSDGEYTLLIPYGVPRTLKVEGTFARDRMAGLALLLKKGKRGCAFTFRPLDTTSFSFRHSKYSSAVNGQGAAPPG